MSPGTLDIINTLAQSVSAIGTLAAVIVALTLARRQGRAAIRIETQIVHTVVQGVPGSQEGPFLQISIINSGFRDVAVRGMGWIVGRFRREHFVQTLPMNAMSQRLPAKLAPGESVMFFFPWEEYSKSVGMFGDAFGRGWLRKRRALTMRFGANLSTGENIYERVSRQVADKILGADDEAASRALQTGKEKGPGSSPGPSR
jgi:hypothetical protein